MGMLVSAARGLESLGNSIRSSVSSAFSGSQRSTNNVNNGPMGSSPRPRSRSQGGGIGSLFSPPNGLLRRTGGGGGGGGSRSGGGGGNKRSGMAAASAAGSFVQPLNPDYDATDPMSAMYASRPSYEQLVAYRDTPSAHVSKMLPGSQFDKPTGMAEGGEIAPDAGGNEVVDSAVKAVTGALTGQEAAIALAMFVEAYGEEELQKLVASVGSSDRDVDGGGEVEGPGTGKSDSVDAQMGNKPYKLSDGEYIMPVEVVDGLGGGDHAKGVEALDRLREMAQSSRPRENAMDPSA